MDAFSIQYTGAQTTAVIWKESGVFYITIGSTTNSYNLSDPAKDTIGELVSILDALSDVTCTLIAPTGTSSSLLNDISQDHKADIKTAIYYAGHSNYSSPKKVTELLNVPAAEIKNSWLDEADADIEGYTGKKFRVQTLTSQSIDVSKAFISTNNDFEGHTGLIGNAYYMEDYAPLVSLVSLTIDGTTVTPSYAILDYSRIILTSDAEAISWVPGKNKATLSITYGYAEDSTEGRLASEYSTLFTAVKYLHASFSESKESGSAATRQHADVVYSVEMEISEEGKTRKDWQNRMKEIKKALGGRMKSYLV